MNNLKQWLIDNKFKENKHLFVYQYDYNLGKDENENTLILSVDFFYKPKIKVKIITKYKHFDNHDTSIILLETSNINSIDINQLLDIINKHERTIN